MTSESPTDDQQHHPQAEQSSWLHVDLQGELPTNSETVSPVNSDTTFGLRDWLAAKRTVSHSHSSKSHTSAKANPTMISIGDYRLQRSPTTQSDCALLKSTADETQHCLQNCKSRKQISRSGRSWASMLTAILALLSTALSGLFMVIALVQPRYGTRVSTYGAITITTSALMTAVLAKTIETTYVTLFVIFLGQELRRRALLRTSGGGFTLADASMRNWLMQLILWGRNWKEWSKPTAALQSYQAYLSDWRHDLIESKNASGALGSRPRPPAQNLRFGSLKDVTVRGAWLRQSFKDEYPMQDQNKIFVSNFSIVMPHPGVPQAARNSSNHVIQLENLGPTAFYSVRASVMSPFLQVLCAEVSKRDISPIVYETWPMANATNLRNVSLIGRHLSKRIGRLWMIISNGDSKTRLQFLPSGKVFVNYYNSNGGRRPVYLLTSPFSTGGDDEYKFCLLEPGLTYQCSTIFNASTSAPSLEVSCDESNSFSDTGDRDVITGLGAYSLNLLEAFFSSMEFDESFANTEGQQGWMFDGSASSNAEATSHPSPAELVAVFVAFTLVEATIDTQFTGNFDSKFAPNYTQRFRAAITAQEYASGGVYPYQRAFHVVLIYVFVTNLFILLYFIRNPGRVTDFSDPPNLFAIAINSPPSERLAGSCGGGPEGDEYQVIWKVDQDDGHAFLVAADEPRDPSCVDTSRAGEDIELEETSEAVRKRGRWHRL
ncbi:uncharacterized protein BDZ99DRAFT_525249 [Mytilinidion resinicola]|uniref:Uncharacterized protein n=1 Tax=Mytilinidion resinicola TaxID=574789 RepID=A0A6A6Y892_9PEZI|nr:uncharacterized protein BDZ99DRAFT_525249 [Mytilinidion resinicola]KAF2804910.1 hypothetical protein BDZ99DRAFT_525249 [Mytilinidion resinicola]